MTETQQNPEWPKEIWLAEREEHDQGCLSAYLSQIGGLADHRYIDADIYESADRYWRERAEKAEAERDAAEALNARHLAEIEQLRALTKPLADTLWLQEEPNSREDLPEEWVAYLEEMEAFSTHYIAKARELLSGGPALEVADGTCVKCGCAPTNAEGFCATCIDERAEVTLQEAAQVLLASVPNPAFDLLKPILMGEHSISFPTFDEEGEEYSRKVNVPWDVQKRIVADALRALAQGGQVDG